MTSVALIGLLFALFVGTHLGLAARPARDALTARLGENGFVLVFSLVAAVTFSTAVYFFAANRFAGGPGPDLGSSPFFRPILIVLAFAGVVFIVAGLFGYPGSPMTLAGRRAAEPRGIARVTRHGFFVGVALLSAAHVLLAPHLGTAVGFALLALLAVAGIWHQDRKLLRLRGEPYARYLAATSVVPFAAVLAGRQRMVWSELPWAGLAAGVAVAFALRAVHAGIFSAGGAWVILAVLGGAGMALVQEFRAARRQAARGSTPRVGAGSSARPG